MDLVRIPLTLFYQIKKADTPGETVPKKCYRASHVYVALAYMTPFLELDPVDHRITPAYFASFPANVQAALFETP